MSIVDIKRNDATLGAFVAEQIEVAPAATRAPSPLAPTVATRENVSRRVTRFVAALRQGGTTGRNGFMLHDRAVYQEFRVSAERQAMNK